MGRTHLTALRDSPTVQITSVVEPAPGATGALDGLAVYPNLAELLADRAVPAALVAVPSDQHLAVVTQLADAGVAVLCEKPCGVGAEQTRAALAVTQRAGIPIQVAYWRRFVPELRALREQIASGDLGEVHLVACHQWDQAPPPASFRQHSGGIFIDMGVHELDQARWLTGQEFVGMQGLASPFHDDPHVSEDPDSAYLLTTMSGGTICLVALGRHHPDGDIVTAEVMGTRGSKRCEVLSVEDGDSVQLAALREQAESFARWVAGGECEGASVADAVAALEAAEQATALTRPGHG
jgi:myo-inositol 2-dehydrogenase/D-chiro-inositol 1-dehydrogenase